LRHVAAQGTAAIGRQADNKFVDVEADAGKLRQQTAEFELLGFNRPEFRQWLFFLLLALSFLFLLLLLILLLFILLFVLVLVLVLVFLIFVLFVLVVLIVLILLVLVLLAGVLLLLVAHQF
jgi:hypothetical protein